MKALSSISKVPERMFANIWKSKYAATIFTVVSIFTMVVGIKIFLERGKSLCCLIHAIHAKFILRHPDVMIIVETDVETTLCAYRVVFWLPPGFQPYPVRTQRHFNVYTNVFNVETTLTGRLNDALS